MSLSGNISDLGLFT